MIDAIDKKIIFVLQNGIPMTEEPFKAMAEEVGISAEEFMERVRVMKEQNVLRRMGGVLRHRHAGFNANALCVWVVPAERVDEVGKTISAEPAVSHCYTRATYEDWPYNFYTMIHAHDKETCDAIAERIAKENQLSERKMFYSVKEWKKASMKYFEE